ncbi:MAG: hypothetical protein EGP06_04570 [SAR202 cluster bacterium]|jgi:L-alanine-DL-glutamate epimerase-like enolase superfamily enzyme|nr:MAG: hypothetical protein EGP09_04110 [SAR202 cluster bacterium]KAA1298408.1 MAG: hypothetical protein EGP06_04570 [SAR202 cluster bacterium]|tara:strand:- start:5 stop:1123 length:1119 start_codon:yes stop_codon:yes gene_type:complete
MKISRVVIDVIERDTGSLKVIDERSDIGGKTTQGVLRLLTDDGFEGNAFIGDQASDSSDRIKIIEKIIAPKIIGMEVNNREKLWAQVEDLSGHGLPIYSSWAPVDVALWDLAGKQLKQPIYKLLGGNNLEIPLYATFPPRHADSDGFITEAEELLDEGFSAYKIHPGALDIKETIFSIDKIRELVGDKMTLMLDRNHGYTLEEALKVGRALDANDFYWYEDPVETSNIRAIKRLKESLVTPINMSDSAGFLIKEAANYLSQNLLGMLRGTTRKLGITGLVKQSAMADAFGINCEIGLAGNSLMNVANLHVIASVKNNTYYEYWRPEHIHQWGVENEIKINSNGKLSIPQNPGLGVDLDEEWIDFHKLESLEI